MVSATLLGSLKLIPNHPGVGFPSDLSFNPSYRPFPRLRVKPTFPIFPSPPKIGMIPTT